MKKLEEIKDQPIICYRITVVMYKLIHTNIAPDIQPLITDIHSVHDA